MSELPPLTIAQHGLVRDAMHVIEVRAKQILREWPHQVEAGDLHTVGKLALYDAVSRFDPKLGVELGAFASLRVYGAMLDTIQAETKDDRIRLAVERVRARSTEYYTDDFNLLHHDDEELRRRLDKFKEHVLAVAFTAGLEEAQHATAQDPIAERQEYARAMAALRNAVAGLEPPEQDFLASLFCDGLTLEELAAQLDRTKTIAWRRVQGILERLRKSLLRSGVKRAPRPVDLDTSGLDDWLPPRLAAQRIKRRDEP
jgi:RNA polymerase sigma factor FliA